MRYILLFICLHTIIGCESSSKAYFEVYDNVLYTDKFKNYYLKYEVPKRIQKNGLDVAESFPVYDSLVDYENVIMSVKSIISVDKFHKIENTSYYMDDNNIYFPRDYNITPKFYAFRKNNLDLKENNLDSIIQLWKISLRE